MPKQIDSGALGFVNKSLGLGGAGDAAITELDDGNLDQVLNVNPIVRRSLVPAASEGIFRGVMRNTHTGPNTDVLSTWTPYNPVLVTRILPYPRPVPLEFDLWLLSACVTVPTVLGTVEASLMIQNIRQGFGVSQAGGFIASNPRLPLTWWDRVSRAGQEFFLTSGTGSSNTHVPWKPIGIRLPRLSEAASVVQVQFVTRASDGPSAYECNLLFGMFPVAIGQDAVV